MESSASVRSGDDPGMEEDRRVVWRWWNRWRWVYNLGLVVAGGVSFIAYAILGSLLYRHDPEFEITVFSVAFQAGAYLVFMVNANLLYCLGPISELKFRPRNRDNYRYYCFLLGLGASILVPALVPLAMLAQGILG